MNGNFILIWDKRIEISNKYKRKIEQNRIAEVTIVSTEEDFFSALINIEPDLLLISDSVSNDLPALSKRIRNLKIKFRPIILFLSKSSFDEDKLNALNSGADDFLSEPMSSDEFLARINAHIRRTVEENSNDLTKLPNEFYSRKIIRRTLKLSKDWAILLLGLNNFNSYKEIYGEIPANKLLQAYSAILNATVEYDDYVGHISDDLFLIITSSYKSEKLADYLNYAFDSIAKRFYSKIDAEKKYILLHGPNKAGCKIPLMTSSIGIVNSNLINYPDELQLMNALFKVQKLAKLHVNSSKVIDRPLLCTEDNCIFVNAKNIVVIEKDIDLAYLLETTLKLQGFNPIVYNELKFTTKELLDLMPLALIIDRGEDADMAFNICKQLKTETENNLKIIFTDSLHEKEKVLSSGADLYLPKPYELMELFQWLYKILD